MIPIPKREWCLTDPAHRRDYALDDADGPPAHSGCSALSKIAANLNPHSPRFVPDQVNPPASKEVTSCPASIVNWVPNWNRDKKQSHLPESSLAVSEPDIQHGELPNVNWRSINLRPAGNCRVARMPAVFQSVKPCPRWPSMPLKPSSSPHRQNRIDRFVCDHRTPRTTPAAVPRIVDSVLRFHDLDTSVDESSPNRALHQIAGSSSTRRASRSPHLLPDTLLGRASVTSVGATGRVNYSLISGRHRVPSPLNWTLPRHPLEHRLAGHYVVIGGRDRSC